MSTTTTTARPHHTTQDCTRALRAHHQDGTSLTSTAYEHRRAPADPSAYVIITRFGSWAAACAHAGLPTAPGTPAADPAPLLEALRAFLAPRPGRARRTLSDYTRWANTHPDKQPSAWSITTHYGSWDAALAAALTQR